MLRRATLLLARLGFAALILSSVAWPASAQDGGRVDVTTGGSRGRIDPAELESFLDGFFARQMVELHVPGAIIVCVQDGEVLASRGYGLADVEKQIPVNPEETVFRIGSVSKLFVATAVMQLVEQGRLDLHGDVNRYLKRFQLDGKEPVTLAHLLTHTAGLGDHWSNTTDPTKVRPLGDYLARHMPPRFGPPGDVISYSNHGYALAAYIVEQVTGVPFDQYVEQRILGPLGMARSGYLFGLPWPEDLAVGYVYNDGSYLAQPLDFDDDYPGGSAISTAADMARFMIAHLQGGCYGGACILQPETVAEMHRQQFTHHPELPGWTYGFQEEFLHGQRVIGHSGAIRGFTSDLFLLPGHNLGYFVSFNHESAGTGPRFLSALEEQFMDRYFPAEPFVPPEAAQADLDHLIGSYRYARYYRHTISKISVLGHDLSVKASGNRLVVRDGEYVPIAPLVFQEVGGKRRIAFRQDGRGRITHMFWGSHAYERLAWYETGAFQRALFDALGWFWGIIAGIWPLTLLVRRWRKLSRVSPFVLGANWLVVLVGLLHVVFLNSLIELFWTSDAAKVVLLILPLAATALTAVVVVVAGLMWWRRDGSVVGRIAYSLVALAAVLFIGFLNHWNFIGFQLG
ncbi:MAG: beta-lactamase family protein [Anaerolineae bacterium]|nr:MAG: beta-lactamase family protein [Anaerolineae bacterium]